MYRRHHAQSICLALIAAPAQWVKVDVIVSKSINIILDYQSKARM